MRLADDKRLTLNGKVTGTVVRDYRWVGNNVEVDLAELDITMQYGKLR